MPSDDQRTRAMLESINENLLSRRQLLKRSAAMGLAIPVVSSLLAACGGEDDGGEESADDSGDTDDSAAEPEDTETQEEDSGEEEEPTPGEDEGDDAAATEEPSTPDEERYGGTFNLAQIGEPPTLDIHQTTATAVAINAWHYVEPLFTWDENLELMMELAENLEVSEDGLTNTVTLREGVNFHNGDVMTSQDVVASIERWAGISGLGESLMEAVDQIEVVDDLTIDFQMNQPLGAFATILARQNQGCGIYPQSVIEESTDTALAEHVGTGPYQVVEHVPDRHIHYTRFENYTDRPEPPSGYGGSKAAYLDDLFFQPVPDEAARISGLQAGEYHYLESIIPDHYETLQDDDRVVVELLPPTSWGTLVVNTSEGLMADQTMRQAVQAALGHEQMAIAGYGEGFYRLDPSVMLKETAWHSTVGEEQYSPQDPANAEQLANEAGYNGETIRLMATQEYAYMYGIAVVAEQQLEDAGFTVEVEVVDWATLVDRRNDPAAWDLFTTGITFRIDPVMLPFMQGTSWPGWWDSDQKVELTQQLQQQTNFDERFATWEEIQGLFYEQVPLIKIADQIELVARSPLLQNFQPFVQLSPAFWNVWLAEE